MTHQPLLQHSDPVGGSYTYGTEKWGISPASTTVDSFLLHVRTLHETLLFDINMVHTSSRTHERNSFALFALAVFIASAAMIYMIAAKQSLGVAALVQQAARKSAFSPTKFEMFDRSEQGVCDRLIVVMPFEWYVWNCRGRVLILNPEGGIRCSAGKMSAVRVTPSAEFVETCVDANLATLIDVYRATGKHFSVPYDLPQGTTTFTILSALNILAKEWLDLKDDRGSANDTVDSPYAADYGARPVVHMLHAPKSLRRKKRGVETQNVGRVHGVYGRTLSVNELERVVRPPLRRASNRDHNQLLEAYRFHVYGPDNY